MGDGELSAVAELLHVSAWLKFGQNLIFLGISLYFARAAVKGHFTSIEEKLERMAASMKDFAEWRSDHTTRLSNLETDVRVLKQKE